MEALILKRQVLTCSEVKRVERVSEKRESLVGELVWEDWRYSGGLGCTEGKEEDGTRGRACSKVKKEEPEALGAILSVFNYLFASVNLKILFCRETILDF